MDREMLPLASSGPALPNLLAAIFAYICLRVILGGCGDLTQDFFAVVLEVLAGEGGPWRGRFRSLLLRALSNFLNDASDRRRSRKRGGDIKFISWDDWVGRIALADVHPGASAPILSPSNCSICAGPRPWWSGR